MKLILTFDFWHSPRFSCSRHPTDYDPTIGAFLVRPRSSQFSSFGLVTLSLLSGAGQHLLGCSLAVGLTPMWVRCARVASCFVLVCRKQLQNTIRHRNEATHHARTRSLILTDLSPNTPHTHEAQRYAHTAHARGRTRIDTRRVSSYSACVVQPSLRLVDSCNLSRCSFLRRTYWTRRGRRSFRPFGRYTYGEGRCAPSPPTLTYPPSTAASASSD